MAVVFYNCTTAPRYIKTTPEVKSTTKSEPAMLPAESQKKISEVSEQAAEKTPYVEEKKESVITYSEEGLATYYADKLQGHYTAFGEKYNKTEFTAAHKTLPYNTMVRVTGIDNNKSVMVRINDRGPHGQNRIIDLSKAAAKEIDLIIRGVMKVRVEVVEEK